MGVRACMCASLLCEPFTRLDLNPTLMSALCVGVCVCVVGVECGVRACMCACLLCEPFTHLDLKSHFDECVVCLWWECVCASLRVCSKPLGLEIPL